MQRPRSARLIAVLVVVASALLPGVPRSSAAQYPQQDNIENLRRQAAQARGELEKATKSWEDRKKRLTASEERLKVTLRDLGAADAQLNQIRGPLARLANIAYQQPVGAGAMAIFANGDPDESLRAAADVTHLAGQQNALIQQATQLRQRHEQLAATAQDLQSRNAVEQARLTQDIDGLKQKSAQVTQQLTDALDKVRADREQRLTQGCNRGKIAAARRFPNGLIPRRYLCELPQKGHYLRADAALAFFKLNEAYKRRFGHQMCITESYRSLGEQQRIYSQRPGMAAVPGRSNHGFGTAVDFCDGVQSQGSTTFSWLQANSRRFVWFHPPWAYSSPFEPWHWEYDANS